MSAFTHPLATAGWPLDRLVSALARSGWDVLTGRPGGGPRAVLRALADLLPAGSATGTVTAHQLADAAGLTERWTRHVLGVFERSGVISWTRGGIIDGRPSPSWIRVSKRAIAALVNRSRAAAPARIRARAAETAARIRDTLRTASTMRRRPRPTMATPRPAPAPVKAPPAQQRPAPRHAELSAALPPNGEGLGPEGSPVYHQPGTFERGHRRAALAAARAAAQQAKDSAA